MAALLLHYSLLTFGVHGGNQRGAIFLIINQSIVKIILKLILKVLKVWENITPHVVMSMLEHLTPVTVVSLNS